MKKLTLEQIQAITDAELESEYANTYRKVDASEDYFVNWD